MSEERYLPDLSLAHYSAISAAICARKVDLQSGVREAAARLERARGAKDDDAAAMAENALSMYRKELEVLEAGQHAFLNARRSTEVDLRKLRPMRNRRKVQMRR